MEYLLSMNKTQGSTSRNTKNVGVRGRVGSYVALSTLLAFMWGTVLPPSYKWGIWSSAFIGNLTLVSGVNQELHKQSCLAKEPTFLLPFSSSPGLHREGSAALLTLSGARCPGTSEPATLGNTLEKQTVEYTGCVKQAGRSPTPPPSSPNPVAQTGILLHFRTTLADTCFPVPAVALPLPQLLHAPWPRRHRSILPTLWF